ncbi:MAG: aspartate aminotransferase family protein [Opitutia bacterium TMED67]|jgi:4-aminobutyrate aminotransferase|nr:aspartate aminotransferase family protein [Verrucomicrobiales bacterium]OUU73107.1 MAG: aspartate aminotransferase family protein [Opitutae bacterium TMED67]|tara:strand:+ start:1262 stop:2551 length:1290 start_codon:yes stop_codon:yes gene_type:complete
MSIDNTEGDFNSTPLRHMWQDQNIDANVRETLSRDENFFLHQSLSTPCLTEIVNCEGSYLIDASGRKFLDFHGNSLHQVGYSHPKIIDAIKLQLDQLSFCPRRFTNKPAIELAEKLGSLAPGELNKVLFAPGGTSAVGMAMKLARYATGRHKTISMWGTFHGASLDAISIGGESLFRDDLGPLLPGCFHVPWPKRIEDADEIEKIMEQEGDIGAIISEPMRCTTVDRPDDDYWLRLRELCDKHGVLLILDEIPLAFGRTGKMFCCEHSGVIPDILIVGKGLGGGIFPLASIIAKDSLNIAQMKALGHYTHEKSPVGAAAALAMFDVIESEKLIDRSASLGRKTKMELEALFSDLSIVKEIRGLGLALAIEITRSDISEFILYECLSNGLSFKVSNGNVLTLTPPLTITNQEMNKAICIIKAALQKAQSM